MRSETQLTLETQPLAPQESWRQAPAPLSLVPVARKRPRLAEERGALTLLIPIRPERVFRLALLLRRIGRHIQDNPHIDFQRLTTVHFLRWAILPAHPESRQGPLLAFESNYDGTQEEHLEELLHECGPALHRIYRHCLGYEPSFQSDDQVFLGYLLRHQQPCETFFRAYPTLTPRRIQKDARLHERLRDFLDSPQGATLREKPVEEIHAALLRHVRESEPELLREQPAQLADCWQTRLGQRAWGRLRSPVLRKGMELANVPLLLSLDTLLRLEETWLRLRGKYNRERPQPRRLKPRVFRLEDHVVQNQLSLVMEVKAGRLRLATLKRVLRAIDFLACYVFTEGALGFITSVHFGRWVLVEGQNGRHWLLFFSNYDGSWESYLGEFVDRASNGLSAIWSNTLGFPETWLLFLRGGSRDEERFKRWVRQHQIATQVWYSAHPDKSLGNILANSRVRQGLCRQPQSAAEIEEWLRLL
jgi:hypothetical protein